MLFLRYPIIAYTILGCGLSMTSYDVQATTVYTANESSQSISIIDTEHLTTTSLALPFSPHNVDLTQDGHYLLVTGAAHAAGHNHALHEGAVGHVALIDLNNTAPTIIADVTIEGHPAHVVPDAQQRVVYVTDANSNHVLVFAMPELRLITTIPTGLYPHGLRLSPDGTLLAVANMKDNTVSLIDLKNADQTTSIIVGDTPIQVAFSPDQHTLIVSLNHENKIAIIDIKKKQIIHKAETGHGPAQVYITHDGRLALVANQGTAQHPDNRVTIVELESGKALKNLVVGNGAHGITISPDGLTAFVTSTLDNTVTAVNLTTLAVGTKFKTGIAPNGIVSR